MQEIQIKENIALLDKAVFNNIKIKNFTNMDELARLGKLEVNEKSHIRYITESGQEFTRLNIKGDELIDRFVAGSKVCGNTRNDYCMLDTSIKNSETGNLICYDVEQYRELLNQIEDRLMCAYGIDADFSSVTLKEIEINRTFKLTHEFYEYRRVLELIKENLPYPLNKHQMDYEYKHKIGTYYAKSADSRKSKRYMELKIYDKSKSVAKFILLEDSYMRVEIKLVSTEKIKSSFGTAKFSDITDELINSYFNKQMQKLIVLPTKKWKTNRDKRVIKLMREQMAENPIHWKTDFLTILQDEETEHQEDGEVIQYCPVLLDISELMPLVNEVIADKDQRYKVKCALRKYARKYIKSFCKDDHLKLSEILEKIS